MANFQLNLHRVISFYLLAKEHSFSRAAELLSITQPAVTQHIRGLEVQFGVKLVNVKKKRVYLTKAGERLLPYAEELFNQAILTENFLKGYRFNHISIGIASPLVFFFTALVDHFKELPSFRKDLHPGRFLSADDRRAARFQARHMPDRHFVSLQRKSSALPYPGG